MALNGLHKLDTCVLVDIDGTLAIKGDRSIFDFKKSFNDKCNLPVSFVIQSLQHYGIKPVFISGRSEEFREVTEKWLEHHFLNPENLFMRQAGDARADYIVKKEIYETHIKGNVQVLGVFDDRKQVKRMWVEEGVFVFDVNQTDEVY